MYRTHNCGELRMAHVGHTVTLSGWVQADRDFGSLTFVDLRDRYGITQLVFNALDDAELCERARKLGREFVISATGVVRERSNKNPNRATGDIEILVSGFDILNASKVPPFTIDDDTDGGDDLRMKYRYLDLRRSPVQNNIIFRSKLALEVRKYLTGQNFVEIETPFLIKSTPEGARDFVVPSRLNPNQFYALPQSPQTFKQILMVAGLDKYFQIVKCFRDEDLRADRQPEFTQIDCEMAFVTQEEILNTFEGLTKHIFNELKADINTALKIDDIKFSEDNFPRMTYDEAMRRYGSDKPDLRFGMEFVELTSIFKNKNDFRYKHLILPILEIKQTLAAAKSLTSKEFNDSLIKHLEKIVGGILIYKYDLDIPDLDEKLHLKENNLNSFIEALSNTQKYVGEKVDMGKSFRGLKKFKELNAKLEDSIKSILKVFDEAESIIAICAPGCSKYSRKQIDELTEYVKRPQIGAKGLVYVRYEADGSVKSSVDKFYTPDQLKTWLQKAGAQPGDLLLILAGEEEKTRKQLNELRLEMGRQLGLMKPGDFKPLWVVDFPLLEWDEDTQRFYAMHHPFTSPKKDYITRMLNGDHQTMKDLRADAYDLVINGVEIGGGSIRIHSRELQEKNFKLLGFTPEEAEAQFGFLLGAFEYGAPPHGGIAFGFDRLCAVMNGQSSIRDFIAFPKNNMGRDMMIDAPSPIAPAQLDELYLALKKV